MRIDAPCLDCGALMTIEMRDGQFLAVDPPSIIGHCNSSWQLQTDPALTPFR
ncbi:MAG: hypothetical protein HY691_11960 [Chloroflexi bacterium]|nr:hypothetical protein [Chloroflexota bacterium]